MGDPTPPSLRSRRWVTHTHLFSPSPSLPPGYPKNYVDARDSPHPDGLSVWGPPDCRWRGRTPLPTSGRIAPEPELVQSLCSIGHHQQLPVCLRPAVPHMLRVDPPGGFNCRRHAQRETAVEQQQPQWTHSPPASPLPTTASESLSATCTMFPTLSLMCTTQ